MLSDPFELNYSKVKAYLDCPHLTNISIWSAITRPIRRFPRWVFRCTARWPAITSRGRTGRPRAVLRRGWHHHGFDTPQQTLEFYGVGRTILENYWRAETSAGRAETVFTEKEFEFKFELWRVRGTIDRVDRCRGADGSASLNNSFAGPRPFEAPGESPGAKEDGYEVIDYKLGFEPKTRADLEGDLQLAMYAIGLKKAFDMDVKAVSWQLLIKGEKVSAPYDPSREEPVLALLRDTGEKILALDLRRKGNCPACSIRKLCPFVEIDSN